LSFALLLSHCVVFSLPPCATSSCCFVRCLLPHCVASLRRHLVALLLHCLFRITSLPLSHYLATLSHQATSSPCRAALSPRGIILLPHVLPLYLATLPCCHCVLPSRIASLPRASLLHCLATSLPCNLATLLVGTSLLFLL
jgi:hypothetical protein